MQKDRTLILAAIETNYGVDATPVAASNAILCSVPQFSVVGRKVERLNALQFMGKGAPLNIGEGLKISFSVEIKGDGSAPDSPPEFGVLLRACNFTETVTAATSVAYALNSLVGIPDSSESVSIYFQQHDLLHKILGARGTAKIDLTSGEYGKIDFEFTGIYAGPTDNSITAGTFNTTLPPRFVSAQFTIDSYSAIIKQLTLDLGNNVVQRVSANEATGILEWLISDREPKFSVDPEMVPIATKDLWAMWSASTVLDISVVVGSVANNTCTIAAKGLPDVPAYADRDNILTLGMNGGLHPSASGNDELSLTFT
jgi:hypothetical protein